MSEEKPRGNPFDMELPHVLDPAAEDTGTDDRDPLPDGEGVAEQSGEWSEWLDDSTDPVGGLPPGPDLDDDVLDYDYPYAGDDVADAELVDRTGGRRGPLRREPFRAEAERPRRGRGPLLALGAAGLTVTLVTAVLAFAFDGSSGPTATTPTAQAVPPGTTSMSVSVTQAPAPHALTAEGCTQSATSGTGQGGTDTGPAAILAFEYAYYVRRSGAAAREVTTPDTAAVPTAADIQRGIDAIEPGTRYCVDVRPLPDGRWHLMLTEQPPGLTPDTWDQLITTTVRDGRTLIVAITPA